MAFLSKKKDTTVNIGSINVNVVIDKVEIHHHHHQAPKQITKDNHSQLKDIGIVAGAVGGAGLGVVQFLADVATGLAAGAVNGLIETAQITGDAINAKQLASKNGNLNQKDLEQVKKIKSRW